MTHGDDVGIVVPPRLAPTQVVIVPIWRSDDERAEVLEEVHRLRDRLEERDVRVHVDDRENQTPGAKFWEWERKGVPFRLELGPRDLEKGQAVLVRRVSFGDEERKSFLPTEEVVAEMPERLERFQDGLLREARRRREERSLRVDVDSVDALGEALDEAGFVYTGWSGDPEVEKRVKEETKATIRVIPDEAFRSDPAPKSCVGGGEATMEVVWARAY